MVPDDASTTGIGHSETNDRWFRGALDDIRTCGQTLGHDEVSELFDEGQRSPAVNAQQPSSSPQEWNRSA